MRQITIQGSRTRFIVALAYACADETADFIAMTSSVNLHCPASWPPSVLCHVTAVNGTTIHTLDDHPPGAEANQSGRHAWNLINNLDSWPVVSQALDQHL